MDTFTINDLKSTPDRLLSDVTRGEAALVTNQGRPIFMAVPLGAGVDAAGVRLELAAHWFEHEQISLGTAALIAGMSVSEIIDELGRRQIPIVRYEPVELARELDYAGSLVDRG